MLVDEYGPSLLLDVLTVAACVLLLVRLGDLRFSHPATPYLIFHLHTVTTRLYGLMNGAHALYANALRFEEVVPNEIKRAAFYCDLALAMVTAVWVATASRARRTQPSKNPLMLDPKIMRPILLVAFVGGIIGLRIATKLPGVQYYEGISQESDWYSSSYLIILPTWFGLAVLGHIYYYGFRPVTTVLAAGYMVLMAMQGGLRFRIIVAMLLMVLIFVERGGLRWPPRVLVLGLIAMAALFFPMKQIGTIYRLGGDVEQMETAFTDSMERVKEGSEADQMFLDEFASALTLLDVRGEKYMGSIYLPLLTLPVPRALWPNKPKLAGYLKDISTTTRPMYTSGMITTYLGEAYANFGIFGIVLVPPIVAFLLAWFHRKAVATPYHSLLRFSYAVLSVNLIQVYRDGLQSVIVFTFVNMMPLAAIVLVHGGRALLKRGLQPVPGRRPAPLLLASTPGPPPGAAS